MRVRNIALLVTLSVPIGMFPQANDDPCTQLIPKQGAFQIKLSDNSMQSFNSSREWFCSDQFVKYAQDSGTSAGLTVPIDGVPIGASFDTKNTANMAARQSFCSNNTKAFSNEQRDFLFIKQGDPTIVQGFVACEQGRKAQQFLHVTANQDTSDTFQVNIDSAPFPGDSPLLVEVRPVLHAVPLLANSFQPGSKIPFEATGASALSGTYQFESGAEDAIVLVRTTIGDKTAVVRKCKQGKSGTWAVNSNQEQDTKVADGTFCRTSRYRLQVVIHIAAPVAVIGITS